MTDFLAGNGSNGTQASPATPEARQVQDRVVEEGKGQAAGGMEPAVLLLATQLVSRELEGFVYSCSGEQAIFKQGLKCHQPWHIQTVAKTVSHGRRGFRR